MKCGCIFCKYYEMYIGNEVISDAHVCECPKELTASDHNMYLCFDLNELWEEGETPLCNEFERSE